MSLRLERVIDEVNRIERKIMMYQNLKKEALIRLKQVENEEIIRSVRSLKLNREELLELLKGMQENTVTISPVPKADGKENARQKKTETKQPDDIVIPETEGEEEDDNKTK